jgi:5-methylcytosine-specific restriction protein A
MPFEDVGTTRRRSMTPARVLRIWEAHAGKCINCGGQIDGTKDRWFVEHARALSLGGKDDDANCGPAHWECKAAKDAEDTARTTKAKHVKQASLGLRPQTLKGQGFKRYEPRRRATTPVEKLQIAYRRPE